MKVNKNNLTAKLQNDFPFVLQWIKKSIDANNGQGSSAFFSRYRHPLQGWSPAFPETTGYLIPTLFDYADYLQENKWKEYATACGKWLLDVQRPSGGFPSTYADNPNLSVFNTAQILFGLLRLAEETSNPKYVIACKKAYYWLIEGTEKGIWEHGNYIAGYVPSYYTRVVWPMLKVARNLNLDGELRLVEILSHFSERINPNYSINKWGFEPKEPAFTHTIAYTLRGFYECAQILNNPKITDRIENSLQALLQSRMQNCKTAGTYNTSWEGDFSFSCPTGNFQLSILLFKLAEHKSNDFYFESGCQLLSEGAFSIPNRDPLTNSYAISGSVPFYGKYMRFKYPNWTAKFYLDAVLQYFKLQNLKTE